MFFFCILSAVHIPFHSKGEKNDEQIDLASDEFDSDSKENENVCCSPDFAL